MSPEIFHRLVTEEAPVVSIMPLGDPQFDPHEDWHNTILNVDSDVSESGLAQCTLTKTPKRQQQYYQFLSEICDIEDSHKLLRSRRPVRVLNVLGNLGSNSGNWLRR